MLLADSFLDYLRYERNYSDETVKAYQNDVEQFGAFVEEERHAELSPADVDSGLIREWVVSLMEKGYASTSVNRKLSTLRTYYKYLLRQGAVVADPLRKVVGPKKRKVLPVFLKETEQLVEWMRRLSYAEAKALWKCNDRIAEQNYRRFQEMDLTRNLTPAVTAYEGIQYQYIVQTSSPMTQYAIDNLGIREYSGNGSAYYMALTDETAEKVAALDNVISVRRYVFSPNTDVFPQWDDARWSQDNFGPIWIPKKGATVELTTENLPLYRRAIETYEGHELEVRDGQILIDGEPATSYTFAMDYYWMMGDNRHNSADSRFWGFVPEDHIVGKASFVWLSLDAKKSFPSNIRWSRMFRKVR